MSEIVIFPRHKGVRCKPSCRGCCLCEGGLFMCDTCGGAEISLPTHCPGCRMDYNREHDVAAGRIDYVFGRGWISLVKVDGLGRETRPKEGT